MCRGYFSSQEIDPHHATEHRSTDQLRNGCGMCCFCHAQPFEITRAKKIKNTLEQHSCQNAKVVEAFCSRRVHHRDRHQHTIPIALAALPGAILPATSCLGAFRTPAVGVRGETVIPAAENLHKRRFLRSGVQRLSDRSKMPPATEVGTSARRLSYRDARRAAAICAEAYHQKGYTCSAPEGSWLLLRGNGPPLAK